VEAYRIRNVEEEEILLWKKSMEFPIQSHLWLTSVWRGYISMSIVFITMEWRGQQHAREAVESTASSATSTIQAMSSTPQPGSDKEGYGRAYAGLIKASKELSFSNRLQELKQLQFYNQE